MALLPLKSWEGHVSISGTCVIRFARLPLGSEGGLSPSTGGVNAMRRHGTPVSLESCRLSVVTLWEVLLIRGSQSDFQRLSSIRMMR